VKAVIKIFVFFN